MRSRYNCPNVVNAARTDVAVPGRFSVVRELGSGGMGKVYEAVDRELALNVALKILHEGDGDAIEQLKHEFRVAADVRHENLVRLGELFEHEHRWCFSMELVEGVDIISYVLRRPKLVTTNDMPTAPRGIRTEERVPWATGIAALFRAALAAPGGATDGVIAELVVAERDCSACGLDLHAAAAIDRRGRLLGGDEGTALVARAAEVARKKEIRRPKRAFAAVAPWPALDQS